jgi:hypothetical protein
MAFADPQSVTINAVANSLPRISSGINAGSFAKDDGNVRLTVSHQYGAKGGKTRRLLRLEHSKIAADPLMASNNVRVGMAAHIVVETPDVGYTIAEAKQIVDALTAYLTASSGARVTQLLGGEN